MKISIFMKNIDFNEKSQFLPILPIFTNFRRFFNNSHMAWGPKVTKKRTFLTPPEEIGGQLCAEEVC